MGRLWNMWSFAHRLSRLPPSLSPPDVVLGSNPHLFAASSAARIAWRLGVPFVLEIRDLWPLSLIEVGGISPYHPLMVWMGRIEKRLYRRAARVICVMPNAADHLSQRAGVPIEPVWIPNGVDLSLVPDLRQRPPGGPFTVMYVGAHGRVNSLDDILDAARVLGERGLGEKIRFRLVGDGMEKSRLEERTRVERIDNVSFEEPVKKEQIHSILESADCFVVTSLDLRLYRYGISFNKLFDYLAAGRPVVIALRSFNNPVEEAQAGFTTAPGDPVSLAAAIERIYRMSSAERWELGQRGRAHVERYHGFARLGGMLERTLAESCHEGAKGASPRV